MMMSGVSKKHVLIVGGTRGMGRTLVRAFAADNRAVSVIGRRQPSELDGQIVGVRYWILNLLDQQQLSKSLAEIVSENGKITNLVFFQQYRGDGNDWTGEIETSLTATRNIIETLSNEFDDSFERSIVIVGSIAGQYIAQEQPLSYHVAKAAIAQLVRFYAVSLGTKGIRVNSVASGTMLKEESKHFYYQNEELHNLYKSIIPLGRMGTSEELSNVIMFLCSAQASFITGQSIVVDGGISLQWHESLARRLTPLGELNVSRKTQRSPK